MFNIARSSTIMHLAFKNDVYLVKQGTYTCASKYFQYAQQDHGFLFTVDDRCYELSEVQRTWNDAALDCMRKGGNLAHIPDEHHQIEMYNIVHQHHEAHGVWIGLNDRGHEEHFVWASGNFIKQKCIIGVWLIGIELTIIATQVFLTVGYQFLSFRINTSINNFCKAYATEKGEFFRKQSMHDEIISIGFIEAVYQW